MQYYLAVSVSATFFVALTLWESKVENLFNRKNKLLKFVDVVISFLFYFVLGGVRNNYAVLMFLPSLLSFLYLDIEDFLWTNFITLIFFVSLQFSFFPFVAQIDYVEPIYFVLSYLIIGLIISKAKQDQMYKAVENMQRLEQLKLIVSILSHRIGTPVNILRLKIDRIANGKFNDSEIESLIFAQNEAENILSSIRESVNNLEIAQKVEIVNLNECLTKVDAHFETEKNFVKCHEDILVTAVKDILLNSQEAGSSKTQVLVKASGHKITLEVLDNGPGFGEEFLENGPRAFYSTKGNLNLGISLFNIKNYFESIGAQILFANTENGAMVKIIFKRADYENSNS